MESNEGMNSANNNFVSGVGIDVSVNSRASNLPKYESLRPSPESTVVGDTTSSSTAKSVLAPETPRWRFVNKAKKTEGYSSSAAGTYVKGAKIDGLWQKAVTFNTLMPFLSFPTKNKRDKLSRTSG